MANKKISELTAIDTMAQGDLFAVVDDPSGTPVTKKATLAQVLATSEKLTNKDQASGYPGLDANAKLPLARLVEATAGAQLIGKASGAGAWEEILVGDGLTFNGTTLEAAGGGSTSSDTEANRPAGAEGEVFFPTNGMYLHRKNATVWEQWGPIFPMTKPVSGDFAWVNQGGASVVDTFGGTFLSGPAGAAIAWRSRVKAKTAPYVITAAFLMPPLSVDFHQFGLLFRQSSDSKLHVFTVQCNTEASQPFLNSAKYTNDSTFSALYTQNRLRSREIVWLRIADNSTNRICSYSSDGQNWRVFHTIGRTDFLTADQVGFAVDVEDATYDLGVTLLSWKES